MKDQDRRLPIQKLLSLQPDELGIFLNEVCDGGGKVAKGLREKLLTLGLIDYNEKENRCYRNPVLSLVDYYDGKDIYLRAKEEDARLKLKNARLGR